MAAVEPAKSATSSTSAGHSGWASTSASGQAALTSRISAAVKRSCTSQRPCQAMIRMWVCRATLRARNSSGIRITRSVPHRRAASSTTCTALALVQQMSVSAFTSAEVLT